MALPDAVVLALASASAAEVRDGLRACRDHLTDARDSDPIEVGDRVLPLAEHDDPKVRQAVADVCEHLPQVECEPVLAALLADSDGFVRRAAESAARRRSERKASRKLEALDEREVGDLLDEIGPKRSKPRRVAERAVARANMSFVRTLRHELIKIAMPTEAALHRIRVEIAKPEIDRALVARSEAAARERLALLWAILDSALALSEARTPSFAEQRLAALVDAARELLGDRLGDRAPRLRFDNAVDPSLDVEVDRPALLQALGNVLQNAVEAYAGDAPELAIRAESKLARTGGRAHAILSIRDRGQGMGPDERARLFVPFVTSKAAGTGVGLSIVRNVVEIMHGGALAIASTPGEGTTVTMSLPLRQTKGRRR